MSSILLLAGINYRSIYKSGQKLSTIVTRLINVDFQGIKANMT